MLASTAVSFIILDGTGGAVPTYRKGDKHMEQSVTALHKVYLARSDLRPSSVRFKEMALRYFVKWFGDMQADQVTPAIAEDFKVLLAKGRSKSAANGYLKNFKPFWTWLFSHRIIEINPFDTIVTYRITEEKKETFSSEDLSRLLRISNELWRVRICLGLLGCRRGEMFHITINDIKLSDEVPHIILRPKKTTTLTVPWDLKDTAVRHVALPKVMYFDGVEVELHKDIVTLMFKCQGYCQPYICLEPKYYKRLIKRQSKGKLTFELIADPTLNFQRMFRALQKRAGVKPLRRFHELRAAFITKMIDNYDLSRAADAAGHSNVQTTRKYHRYSQMSLIAEMGKLAEKCYRSNVP